MLASINPLGERSRNSRFAITFTAYLTGSVAGGAGLGALLGSAGAGVHALVSWSAGVTATAVIVLCAFAVVLDAGVFGLRIPTVRRQVDEDMLNEYREWAYGLNFGLQLGAGVVTIVTTATVYVTFALAFLTGAWQAGLLVGAVFGLVRALPMVLVARVHDPLHLRRIFGRVEAWAPIAERGSLGVLVVVGGVAATVMWGSAAVG